MYSAFSDVFLVHKKLPAEDMSKQSSLLHLWGKRKELPNDEDEDQSQLGHPHLILHQVCQLGRKIANFNKFGWKNTAGSGFRKIACSATPALSAKASLNPFIEGCLNFQNSTLTRHEQSKAHLSSFQVLNLRSNFRAAQMSAVDLTESDKVEKLSEFT